MSNIRVDIDYALRDGLEMKFRSPVDCSAITGLIVYYPGEDGSTTSQVFTLADAHGNNVGDIDHLFAENVVVKVILDVTTSMAFVQNADTNAYLEAQFASKAPAGLVTKTIKVADEEALNNALSEEFATMADDSARFIVVSPTSGALFGGVGMLCELYKRSSSGYGAAKFTGYGVNSPDILYKTLWAGTWQPLEWVNPPMHIGVEYRTTARWNGKVVWTTLINLGQLTTGKLKVDTGITVTNIIRHSGTATGSWSKSSLPALYSSDVLDEWGAWIGTDTSNNGTVELTAYRGSSYSAAATIYCQLWYTKD